MKKYLTSFAALAVFASPAMAQEMTPLTIQSGETTHTFRVEVADEPAEISRGLMDRTEMAEDAGMIFDFGQPRVASMWMKDTILPLDMLFVDGDGTVLAIAHNTQPGSLRQVSAGVQVKSVIELNAGRADALGIKPGDTVQHDIFGNM